MAPAGTGTSSSLVRLFVLYVNYKQFEFANAGLIEQFVLRLFTPRGVNQTVPQRPSTARVQRLIVEPMQERKRERIVPQSLHLPGPDSPTGASVAIHVRVKRFEGDVDTPWKARFALSS
jgi:hypothetical protein